MPILGSMIALVMLSLYQMGQSKVNLGCYIAGSRPSSAGEGLRILARLIARRLVARKSGVDARYSSDYSRLLMRGAPTRKEARDGGN